jgi:hypothetical protein
MTVEIRQSPVGDDLSRGEGKKLLRDFLDVVSYIYAGDPQYVRSLDFDLKDRLSKKNPFFLHAEGAIFVDVVSPPNQPDQPTIHAVLEDEIVVYALCDHT